MNRGTITLTTKDGLRIVRYLDDIGTGPRTRTPEEIAAIVGHVRRDQRYRQLQRERFMPQELGDFDGVRLLDQQWAERMQAAQDDYAEVGHARCDNVLIALVRALGFHQTAAEWERQDKWYA